MVYRNYDKRKVYHKNHYSTKVKYLVLFEKTSSTHHLMNIAKNFTINNEF